MTASATWDDAGPKEELSGDYPMLYVHKKDRSFGRVSSSLSLSFDTSLESHAMSSSCGLFILDTNALKQLYPGDERKVATLALGSSGTVRRYFRCCHSNTTEFSYVAHHVPLG